jgi:hypothetical protein
MQAGGDHFNFVVQKICLGVLIAFFCNVKEHDGVFAVRIDYKLCFDLRTALFRPCFFNII